MEQRCFNKASMVGSDERQNLPPAGDSIERTRARFHFCSVGCLETEAIGILELEEERFG
jgi:hypothetical protein